MVRSWVKGHLAQRDHFLTLLPLSPTYPHFSLQFKRLQGKRNRGREEINFVEIKGDDQLSGAQQWMTKSLTEEKSMKSFSKVSWESLTILKGRPQARSDPLLWTEG